MGLIPPFCTMSRFLSTPSARRATSVLALRFSVLLYFYPRPPRGGRHYRLVKLAEFEEHFYPRPPRGGRRPQAMVKRHKTRISIHALREEGDRMLWPTELKRHKFLSTPSARRATPSIANLSTMVPFLSTPSARRATPPSTDPECSAGRISIHALREEGDLSSDHASTPGRIHFYPRPPRGGRPVRPGTCHCGVFISIHALREEGDGTRTEKMWSSRNFYPRPPRGGRLLMLILLWITCYFYPRPPRGGRQQKQRQNLYFLINYTTFCTNLEEL